MDRILTKNIATMTEMREPQKVLDRANGEPVAILKNSKVVGYLVPQERTDPEASEYASLAEIRAAIDATREQTQPVLDYLKDK